MKKIMLIWLILSLVIVLVGCYYDEEEFHAQNSSIVENYHYVNSDYIDLELVEDNTGYIIVYDKHTKVLYLIMDGYRQSTMTPIYNTDGSLKLYE